MPFLCEKQRNTFPVFSSTENEKERILKPQKNLRRTTQIEWGLQTENFANDYQLMLFIALI